MNIYPFIEAEKAQQHSVTRACRLLQVSRAAYYTHRAGPSRHDRADDVLTTRIRAVHAESKGRYGAPRVHAELARRGHQHGRCGSASYSMSVQECLLAVVLAVLLCLLVPGWEADDERQGS